MKKYLLLLLVPLFALACSSDEENSMAKNAVIKAIGEGSVLLEYTEHVERGAYEDSKLYDAISNGEITIESGDGYLTTDEVIESFRDDHTETMYNCSAVWEHLAGHILSADICVNTKGYAIEYNWKQLEKGKK